MQRNLSKEYGQPEVTETMLKWNSLGSFGKGERETYIVDESIPHAFPKPHRDYVYTVMNIKVPSDMLDTLGHVTGSIIYDGLKEEVTQGVEVCMQMQCTLGFVRDMVEGKVTTDKDGAKKEYADRITKDPLPKTYDNKMDEGLEHMCGCGGAFDKRKFSRNDRKDYESRRDEMTKHSETKRNSIEERYHRLSKVRGSPQMHKDDPAFAQGYNRKR